MLSSSGPRAALAASPIRYIRYIRYMSYSARSLSHCSRAVPSYNQLRSSSRCCIRYMRYISYSHCVRYSRYITHVEEFFTPSLSRFTIGKN